MALINLCLQNRIDNKEDELTKMQIDISRELTMQLISVNKVEGFPRGRYLP